MLTLSRTDAPSSSTTSHAPSCDLVVKEELGMTEYAERGCSPEDLARAFDALFEEHPELVDALGLWITNAAMLDIIDPDAAAIFADKFPELRD